MHLIQRLFLVAVVLATSACAAGAGNLRSDLDLPESGRVVQGTADTPVDVPIQAANASSPEVLTPSTNDVPVLDSIGSRESVPVDVTPDAASSEGVSEAEQDAEALYADAVVWDPWERFNRKIYRFNSAADRYVVRPLALGYASVIPEPVQTGVSKFLETFSMPATAVNQALQGQPTYAMQSLGRFLVNATVGIGGIWDVATHIGIPYRDGEDFGQTLATWGWRDSRYLMIPFLGPGTVRDTLAIAGDQMLSPIRQINDSATASALQVLEIVDGRVSMLSMDQARRDAYDEYTLVRDAWTQRRNFQIRQDSEAPDNDRPMP